MSYSNLARRDELYICEQCRRTVERINTHIIVDQKDGRLKRFCQDCAGKFYEHEVIRKSISGLPNTQIKIWAKEVRMGKYVAGEKL